MTAPEPVVYRRIPSTDPRLGRHVRHDPRSRAYAYPTAGLALTSARHTRRIGVLDQLNTGSCTGQAGIGCLGTDPLYATVVGARTSSPASPYAFYSLDEPGALRLYSDAETIDGDGPFPPNDNGSTGLSVAKALKNAGEIAGYQHTFSLTDALLALGQTPVIAGTEWTEAMFSPDVDGRLHPTGAVAGGHEYVLDEIDVELERVWLTNSWGDSWGLAGRAYLSFDDFGALLDRQGDVTIFAPLTAPAPTPSPTPAPTPVVVDDVDRALAVAAHRWLHHPHTAIAGNAEMRDAVRTWLKAKAL